jgi:hypothetical protein
MKEREEEKKSVINRSSRAILVRAQEIRKSLEFLGDYRMLIEIWRVQTILLGSQMECLTGNGRRGHLCNTVAKNRAVLCTCTRALWKAGVKSDELGFLVGKGCKPGIQRTV